MDTEDSFMDTSQQLYSLDDFDEIDGADTLPDAQSEEGASKNETMVRRFRLLHLLLTRDCMRQEIFERLKDYYKYDELDDPRVSMTSQRVGRMLIRDIQFLEKMGYKVNKSGVGNSRRYGLVKGSGPGSTFLFSQAELDTLALLHTLFADPTKYAQADATQPLPTQPPHNPFAEDILALIERLVATLPLEQKKYFGQWVRKPFVYFNMDTVNDYLPHRATIDTIVQAISRRQQVRFEYASLQQQKTPHEHVDPYYIVHQDGHLYLIGYSHKSEKVLEYRIDRINAESIELEHDTIDGARRQHPLEFSYWIDGSIAKSGLSQRWLSHTIEREEVYVDEENRQRRRVLVRAKAYNEWRIIQQLHKYGDKVELVGPPKLREWMRKEVERMYRFYQK